MIYMIQVLVLQDTLKKYRKGEKNINEKNAIKKLHDTPM